MGQCQWGYGNGEHEHQGGHHFLTAGSQGFVLYSLGFWLWNTQKVCTWDCWQSKWLILIIPYSLDGLWLTSPLITFLIDLNWMGPSVFLKIFHTFDGKNMEDPRCFQMFPADLHRQKSQGWGGSPGCGDVGQAAFAELELIKRMNSWPEYPSEIENLLDTTLMTFMNLVHRSLLSVPFPLLDGVDGQVSSTRSRISCSCSTATISRSQALLQHTMAGQDSVRHLFFFPKECCSSSWWNWSCKELQSCQSGCGSSNTTSLALGHFWFSPALADYWVLHRARLQVWKRTVKPFLPIILIRGDQDLIYTKGLRGCRSTQGLKDNGTTYLGSDGAAAMAECAGEAATKAMAGKTIIFVRHGESEYNKARSWGRWQWHAVTVSFLQIWSDCWQQVGDLSLLAWGTVASSHVSSLQRGID